jgi:hypothetical protein
MLSYHPWIENSHGIEGNRMDDWKLLTRRQKEK